jgi:hypothetical protein
MGNRIPKGYQQGSLQQFTPEQMGLLQQLLQGIGGDSFLSQLAGGDEEAFAQMEAPALRQFGQLQGNIASRFSGMGDTGGRHSSGFGHELTSAGSNFAQDLASKRMGLQRQAMMDLYGLGNQLLGQRPQANFLVKKPGSWLDKLLGTLGGAATGGATGYATGGWPGAAIGAAGGAGAGYQGAM